MIRLRPSGVDEILIKRVQDWYEPGPGVFIQSLKASFSPAMLFTGSTTGAWYDPSDTTTLYRDAAGTLPVTAVEQPVGLMLDKSNGGVGTNGAKRVNLLTKTEQFDDAAWTKSGTGAPLVPIVTANQVLDPNGNLTADKIVFPSVSVAGNYSIVFQSPTQAFSTSHMASIYLRGNAGGEIIWIMWTTDGVSYSRTQCTLTTSWQRFTLSYTTSASGPQYFQIGIDLRDNAQSAKGGQTIYAWGADLRLASEASTLPTYQKITDTWYNTLPGNHAFNGSGNSANFPVLSARYNLLTKTEQFTQSPWATYNLTIQDSTSDTLDPKGGNNASKAIYAGAAAGFYVDVTINTSYTYSIYAKKGTYDVASVAVAYVTPASSATFNLTSGVASGTNCTATMTSIGNDWWLCKIVFTASGSARIVNYCGTTTGHNLYYFGADLRVTNDAMNQPAYQRVNTSTDYDTVGFKPAEVFDGIDDNLIAPAGGGSTTSFFWCSAIRVGKVGAVQTLFSDAGTNTGYRVRINASNQLELSAGNGTAYTTVATTATLSIGQRAVLTAWHDGTNLNVQINNGTVHQASFATATAGTAQFTIGKDNNAASNFFAGRLYEKVYTKDNVPSAAQITSTKTYVANIAGITLS